MALHIIITVVVTYYVIFVLFLQAMWTRGMKLAVGLWASFGGSHLLMSHTPVREKLINICGSEQRFRVVYSAIAVGTLLPFALMYARTPLTQRGPVVLDRYRKASLWKHTSAILRALGGFCIADAFMTAVKNPLAMNARMESPEPTDPREIQRKYQVYGLQRITRHPEALGVSLYALGSMMRARRTPADLVLWGMAPIFSIIATLHQEARLRQHKPVFYFEQTSYVPFGAVWAGQQRLGKVVSELPPTAYAVAFCIMGHTYFWRWT